WANVRALMGHPASFGLEYIGIGNEQWNTSEYQEGEDYWAETGNNFFKRYEAFEKAIHKVAPEMKLISTSGPASDGTDFVNAWNWLKTHKGEDGFTYAVDEHYYKDPDWFYNNVNRYDDYDRNGFSVFAGEYASRWWSGYPRGNTLETALSEAAYMTGLEKNSDIVKMASYAPLFAKLGATQWTPDMIWFDSDTSYGSPDYYVQQLFSRHTGDYNVENEVVDREDTRSFKGFVGLGTWITQASFRDYTVTDNDTGEEIALSGWQGMEAVEEPEKYSYEILEVSSEPEANNPASAVNDGDLNTGWSSQGRDNYIVLDLGDVKTVGKVGVANVVNGDRYYYYAVQTSVDGETYETITPDNSYDVNCLYEGNIVLENATTNGKGSGEMVYHLNGNREARYIKVLAKGNSYHNWNNVREIEVYGECEQQEAESPELAPTGSWTIDENGVISQSTGLAGAYVFANEAIDSENYTITFKATKTGGDEGFIIPFMAADAKNFYIWNIAGWGNTSSAFQQCVNGINTTVSSSTGTVLETDVEYEIKIVVEGSIVSGYIDGELINRCNLKKTLGPVYGNATFDERTGDIIVKLVNSDSVYKDIPVTINYSGTLSGTATQYLLTGDEYLGKNSIDDPENIAIKRSEIDGIANEFEYRLPGYSTVVLRIHTSGSVGVDNIEQLSVSTQKNVRPELPAAVTVTLADGTTEERKVTWKIPEYGVFANAGSFKVYGTVEGTELDAEAVVTVETEVDAIKVDAEQLLSGETTLITFNADAEGSYKGIVAVYGENGLESTQTIDFTGIGGAMAIKLEAELEGKTVKVMLWDSVTLDPVTEALSVK
ncbi:MAG: alpha-L-arabinofuranosidase C-terminal domain-containing protein, partial [Clostridia bacterium]